MIFSVFFYFFLSAPFVIVFVNLLFLCVSTVAPAFVWMRLVAAHYNAGTRDEQKGEGEKNNNNNVSTK